MLYFCTFVIFALIFLGGGLLIEARSRIARLTEDREHYRNLWLKRLEPPSYRLGEAGPDQPKPMVRVDEPMVTTAEAAEMLGMQPSSIRSLVHRGKLTKVGKTLNGQSLIRRQEVEDILAKRREIERKLDEAIENYAGARGVPWGGDT